MILYFANRQMEILGKAATNLKRGFVITEDLKTEDVENGVAVFDCKIGYIPSNRKRLENMTKAGNYILRQNEGSTEFYTIIDREIDTKHQTVYVYAEDAGLDLINEIAEAFTATEAHPADWYINKWIIDSGFEIGINEIPASSQRKLTWDGEATVTERLASIATQFGGYEISFSFAIKGMEISNKYVNIHEERGKNTEEQLRLDRDIDRITITESVANLATALRCTGGMLEDGETYIDLKGYKYDDGDFYVANDGILRSRNAVAKWSRYVWNKEPNKLENYAGHIIRSYSYDTLNQATLCAHAVTELKKICDAEVNYEIDLKKLPENIKIGDRVNIVDAAGELYLSSRILKLETSVTENTQTATIGEHLIKEGGISLKVEELAAQFSQTARSAAKAKAIADAAKVAADNAKTQSDNALNESIAAQEKADEATQSASQATSNAAAAQQAATNAQAAVDNIVKNVDNLSVSVSNAEEKAQSAKSEAETAQAKADEAAQAAANARAEAANAQAAVIVAQGKAETAITKAETAQGTAESAQTEANTAKATADAAKLDAEKANEDIANLGNELDTLSQTMEADYARKTDLTEAEAHLQTQITQNAAGIASNASQIVIIDETANNASEQAEAAQKAAEAAQAQADTATADADAAQKAADEAAAAATAAQNEADTAKAAAATAQSAANKAQDDLSAAQAELNKVKSDVTATQEEIAAAEQAVANAQAKADAAQVDAATAAQKATQAQTAANTASQNAINAQSVANQAAKTAADAQAKAEAAQGDATEAINTANTAKNTAAAAQEVANTAKTNATNAQAKANEAADEAAAAQAAAIAADAKAAQAAEDLETAKTNLAAVTSRVDATEDEIAAAEAAVTKAQAAADAAKADAATAQSTANTAKNNAATAQTAANNAKAAADAAQEAADDAQAAADAAQEAVDALAVRVTKAETSITQNAEQIALRATKTEVANTLSGYYTKTETNAAITAKANEITSTVEKTYQKTVSKGEQLVTNGNGLMGDNTNFSQWSFDGATVNNSPGSFTLAQGVKKTVVTDEFFPVSTNNEYTFSLDAKSKYGLTRIYSMLVFFDVDKKEIQAPHHMHLAASTTTLARDLKAGDTVIYLTSAAGWSTTYSHGFYMTIWNYTNSYGFTYPAGTYSRNRVTLPKTSSNTLDANYLNKTANTITLSTAYSGATIPAGTAVSQGGNGANYKYVPLSNKLLTTEWVNYSGKYSGVDNSGANVSGKFPPGTAYAKVGFLWNYNAAADQTWATNIVVTDTTAVNAAQAAASQAQSDVNSLATRVTQTESSITSQASSISSLGTRMSTVEQTANGLTVSLQTTNNNVTTAQNTANAANTAAQNAQANIDNLSVGGRNLIAGTSEAEIVLGGYPSSSYSEGKTGKTIGIPQKNEYVLSFEAKSTVANDKIVCHFYSPNTTTKVESSTGFTGVSSDGRAEVILTTSWKKYYVKYTQDGASTTTQKAWIIGRRTAGHGTGSISIRSIKLEEGNKATSWTPAPEDVNSSISTAQTTANNAATAASNAQSTANTANGTATTARTEAAAAAKTASNFLSYDSTNGLLIGNKSSGSWVGNRAQILPSAFNILDSSGATLASFGSNTIYLGKNSQTSKIDLLNGVANLYAETSESGFMDRLYISARNVYLKGTNHSMDVSTQYNNPSQKFAESAYATITANAYQGTTDNWASTVLRATHAASGNFTQIYAGAYDGGGNTTAYIQTYSGSLSSQLVVNPSDIVLNTYKINIINSSTEQSKQPGFAWKTINGKNPYIGYCSASTDGTFMVGSIAGTSYTTGLSIGGSSGNLLWKGNRVLDASNYSEYALPKGGTATKAISDQNGKQIDRVYCSMIPAGTNIAANSNLNTINFLKVGNYYCGSNANAATLTNCPTAKAFMMQVYTPLSTTIDNESTSTWVYRLRKIITHLGDEYVQQVNSQGTAGTFVFGAWKKITNSSDLSSYLPLTGGTLSGSVTINATLKANYATLDALELSSATPYIDFHYGASTADYTTRLIEVGAGALAIIVSDNARFQTPNEQVGLWHSSNSSYSAHFRPDTDGKCTLGIAAKRWYAVYASNASIQTSDRREKENIKPFGVPEMMVTDGVTNLVDLHSELFDRLQPVQYNMTNGNGKVCYGLIAQDVVEALHEVGIGEDDLDLVHHDFWTDEKNGDAKESYGIAYTNLIAMLIHEVQKLKCEVQQLKNAA